MYSITVKPARLMILMITVLVTIRVNMLSVSGEESSETKRKWPTTMVARSKA
jgi:hypothetical protein